MNIQVKNNIQMSGHTNFSIGGPAKYFCEVVELEELKDALSFAKKENLPVLVIGGGSNLLISDEGFDGLVIKIKNPRFQVLGTGMIVGAGLELGYVIKKSVESGLAGMESMSGIPGTIGGATRGNAGAFGQSVEGVVERVQAFDSQSGEVKEFDRDGCQFGYRNSIFKQNPSYIIWSIKLKFEEGDVKELTKKAQEIISLRNESYLPSWKSAGSFFKNIHDESEIQKFLQKFPDMTQEVKDWGDRIPAACLIDECGLKDFSIGGASISASRPNFILNSNDASAEDVIMLMSTIKNEVMNKFGVSLEPEVQFVGF